MCKKWSSEEFEIIEMMSESYTVEQIQLCLRGLGYNRTTKAVMRKLSREGYSIRPILDNYSCTEIAKVLNLNSSTVCQWARRGWIKVARRSAKRYQIRAQDLKRFLKNPPQQIQKRITAIDPQAIKYLVG